MKKGNPGKTQEKSTLMKVLSCWQLYVLMIPALVWPTWLPFIRMLWTAWI